MIIKKIKMFLVSGFIIIFNSGYVYPFYQSNNFSNSGQLMGLVQNIVAYEKLENNGDLIAEKSINIECGNLVGKGMIKGPNISIFAKEFNFTGTIDCSNKCVITTSKKLDQSKFKRRNKGKFIFKVEPNLVLPSKKLSQEEEKFVSPFTVSAITPINQEKKKLESPLPGWWEGSMKDFSEELNDNCSIYRVYLKFDVNNKKENLDIWINLCSKVDDILSYMRTPAVLCGQKTLYDYINDIPYEEFENSKDINCKVDIKVFKITDIKNKIEDKVEASQIMLSFFILFDHTQPILNEIFQVKTLTARQALNIFYEAAREIGKKDLNDIVCRAKLYVRRFLFWDKI